MGRIFICLYADSVKREKEKEVTEQEEITDAIRGPEVKNKVRSKSSQIAIKLEELAIN